MHCLQRVASRSKVDALEMYRRIATLDAGVPLPELPDTEVDWMGVATEVRKLGLDRLAARLEAAWS